jgi:hypothetical protein
MAKRLTRYQHTAVSVKGKKFKSLRAAFDALKLPLSKHQRFRKELRQAGQATFHDGRKRPINFKIANDNGNHSAA